LPPKTKGGGAPRGACLVVCRAHRSATGALRSAPSPFGAPPVAIFGSRVRASVSGIVLRSALSETPRSRVVVPGGRIPVPPEAAVTSRRRRTPLPAPPPGSSREAPSTSGNDWSLAYIRYVVNLFFRFVDDRDV